MANNMSRQVVPFCILCNKILTTSVDVGDLKHFQDRFDGMQVCKGLDMIFVFAESE